MGPAPTHSAGPTIVGLPAFALAFVAAFAFALTCRYPGYVHHDTAEIAMWSRLPWPLGLPKHPPLLPWLFRAYSLVVPLNWMTLDALTAANIIAGAAAVFGIARLTLDRERAVVALLLYGLAPAGTFFALKLNHNGILVSLWPLTILAFVVCLKSETATRSALAGVAFGALAAAAMLAKYYSGVLLASCVIAALASPQRVRFFSQPGGYLAVATFTALVAPHGWWMITQSHGATLDYAFHEAAEERASVAHFLGVGAAYLIPPGVGFLALRRWLGPGDGSNPSVSVQRELLVLAIAPFMITAAFIAVFKLRGATSWSLPDFCVLPAVLAAHVAAPDAAAIARLKRWAAMALGGLAVGGPVVLAIAFAIGDGNAVDPRAEAAVAAGQIFEAATARPVSLVAGDPKSANSAAVALASRPLVYSNFDPASAPWVTPSAISAQGVLVICHAGQGCDAAAEALRAQYGGFHCALSLSRRWLGMRGPPSAYTVTVIPPTGISVSPERATVACQPP